MDGNDLTPEDQKALTEIRKKKSSLIQQHRIKNSTAESRPIIPRKFDKDGEFTTKRMGRQLSQLGLNPSLAVARIRSKTRGQKRGRSLDRRDSDGEGFKDSKQKVKALKLGKNSFRKRNKDARKGEADRVIPTLKPKHLFSGKRSIGKTQRH
ncbi:hypothetical protein SLE2022_127520 [Rubroshorea leprosula]